MAKRGKSAQVAEVILAAAGDKKAAVEADLKKVAVERKGFAGFKADLKFTSPEFSVTTPIRYEKLTAADVQERLRIVHRHISGVEVLNKPTPYHWAYLDAQGKEYPEGEVKHFQVLADGKEVEVQPFPRTKVLEVKKLLPATSLSEFLTDSQYELWAEGDAAQLLGFAEYLSRNDSLAVSKMSFGRGFKESYALIYPLFQNGKFVLVMALTQKRVDYKHWMPVKVEPSSAVKSAAATPVSVLEEI